ncbi:hypothetical protein BOX15_Mlig022310g2, partial [Macrostomum lignano]
LFKMSEEMNEIQKVFQDEVHKQIGLIDKQYLRKLQADTFRCSIRCVEDVQAYPSPRDSQSCLERCGQVVQQAEKDIEVELSGFQNRVQRCMMDCGDRAKDGLPASPSSDQIAKARVASEACAEKCVRTHLEQHLPTAMKKIGERLKGYKVSL